MKKCCNSVSLFVYCRAFRIVFAELYGLYLVSLYCTVVEHREYWEYVCLKTSILMLSDKRCGLRVVKSINAIVNCCCIKLLQA